MDLGPSKKWHGQPSSIEVADNAINQRRQGRWLIGIKIWVVSYLIVRPPIFLFLLSHEACFVHLGVGPLKIGLHNNQDCCGELKISTQFCYPRVIVNKNGDLHDRVPAASQEREDPASLGSWRSF